MSCQLDTQETTGTFALPSSYRTFSAHSCEPELAQVRLVYSILDGCGESPHVNRLDECRTSAWFVRHVDTGKVRIATKQCHVRFCPLCSDARQAFLTSQVSAWLEPTLHPKLLTVTLKHSNAPLAWQIKNLYQFFRKFRRRAYLKKRISGGVWFFQVKKSKSDNKWHPHLHALIDGDYLDKFKLSKLWSEISGGSFVVDIKTVKDKDNAIRHVARYAARPSALADLDIDDACEMVSAMRGVRLVGTWGTARKISLRPKKPDDAESWVQIGSWSMVYEMQSYDSNAEEIIKAFMNDKPLDAEFTMRHLEKEIADEIEDQIHGPPKEYQTTFFNREANYDQCSQS